MTCLACLLGPNCLLGPACLLVLLGVIVWLGLAWLVSARLAWIGVPGSDCLRGPACLLGSFAGLANLLGQLARRTCLANMLVVLGLLDSACLPCSACFLSWLLCLLGLLAWLGLLGSLAWLGLLGLCGWLGLASMVGLLGFLGTLGLPARRVCLLGLLARRTCLAYFACSAA